MSREQGTGRPGNGIGTYQETSLHAQLKALYAGDGAAQEVNVGGYLVDVVRDNRLIEIQTGSFGALRKKLRGLLAEHELLLVCPIAERRWIRRVDSRGGSISRRKSPKRGRVEDIFSELVSIAHLVNHRRLQLEIVLVDEEVVWRNDGRGSWRRRGWSVSDRRLLAVNGRCHLREPGDYLALLPSGLGKEFTNGDLSKLAKIPPRLAQQITYTLRKMDLLQVVGKQGRFNLYRRVLARS